MISKGLMPVYAGTLMFFHRVDAFPGGLGQFNSSAIASASVTQRVHVPNI